MRRTALYEPTSEVGKLEVHSLTHFRADVIKVEHPTRGGKTTNLGLTRVVSNKDAGQMILELGDHHTPNTHKANMETVLEKAHTIWP